MFLSKVTCSISVVYSYKLGMTLNKASCIVYTQFKRMYCNSEDIINYVHKLLGITTFNVLLLLG